MRADLRDLVTFLELSRSTTWTIWRNYFWAFCFNIVMLPVASGTFWFWGYWMSPKVAGMLMAMSSLLVISSSLLLRNFKPRRYNGETKC